MRNRIKNLPGKVVTQLSPAEAKELLRVKCLLDAGEVYPGMELFGVLLAAYPEAEMPAAEDGEPGGTDWQKLAWLLAIDFVPAFEGALPPGRPTKNKVSGIVAHIDEMVKTGRAKTKSHAFSIAERAGTFPGISDVRRAYYRERKKLSQ